MVNEETWRALVEREEGRCQSCGEEENLMPCHYIVSNYGGDGLDNLWLGCFWCHRLSHDGKLSVKKIKGKFYFKRI
jgi:hypothetical protein